MKYWLVKTEPATYGWDDLVKKGIDRWDGVRNYQARNFLKAMKKGDRVFIYHSVQGKEIVGVAVVEKEFYPDPVDTEDRWVVVDFRAEDKLKVPVSLEQIKADGRFENFPLLKQSRLSVMPVAEEYVDVIFKLGGGI